MAQISCIFGLIGFQCIPGIHIIYIYIYTTLKSYHRYQKKLRSLRGVLPFPNHDFGAGWIPWLQSSKFYPRKITPLKILTAGVPCPHGGFLVQIGFPFFSWVRFVGDFPLKIFQGCKLAINNPAPGCFERAKIAFTPLKTNISPKKVTISVGNTSSNHHFSGDMLVFRGGCFSHCIDESEARKGFFVAAINCCITAIHMEHQGRSTPYIGAELIPPWDPFMIDTLRKGVEKKNYWIGLMSLSPIVWK